MRTRANDSRAEKKAFKTFYPLLTALCLVSIFICTFGLITELYARGQGRSYYAEMSSMARPEPGLAANEGTVGAVSGDAEDWEPYTDFEALRETNPGLVAWIRCEGTKIDYPVVQGTDNEYYLTHLPDGTKNKIGSIFLDYRCRADFSGKNSVIYGHHMKNGDMFAALENYRTQTFYDEHPVITLHTQENDYLMEIFAGYVVDAEWETLSLSFDGDGDFERHIDAIRRRSVFTSDVEVNPADKVISLSTCAYDFSEARFVIVGKLTETKEKSSEPQLP